MDRPFLKRAVSFLLTATLLCGLMALAEQDVPQDDLSRFSLPHIAAPTIPPIEVPEIEEIEVPKIPTAAPTKKPKIEVPDIPDVDVPDAEVPRVAPDDASAVETALAALGVDAYRALYDALKGGEAVGEGSRGDAAMGLQQLLVAFGQAIRVDGIVGPKTIAALNAVQAQHGLPQTERMDAAGLAVLLPLLVQEQAGNTP